MGAGLLTTGRGGELTKVYLAKDVVTKVYFCKSPQASAATPRWGNCLRFEMGNIYPRFTSTVISYINLVEKWGKNIKQSRS